MEVQRYIPPAEHPLKPYLQSIWRGRASGAFRTETILPKGNVDIIFNLGDPSQLVAGKLIRQPVNLSRCFLQGVQTGAIQAQPGKNFDLIGISLTLEGSAAILPLPASELTDRLTESSLLFEELGRMLERLFESTDFHKQVPLLLHWLMRQVRPPARHKMIRHVCARLRHTPTEANLRDITQSLQISERHLRRLFLEQIGVSPSRYIRLSRFINAIQTIPTSSSSLTEIAHSLYYSDQAHFCRDFKEIAGLTPREYRNGVTGVPGHIFS